MASTTSTQDSGLFDYLLPIVKQKTGIDVKVISQGTGQALDTGRRGDADVVFVHAKSAEEKFLAEGQGVKRYPVMYNDFVLIGPKGDPAGIKGMKDVGKAFTTIKDKKATFISRGDKSGTNSPSSSSGKTPASISIRIKAPGTRRSARAWVPRSTPPAPTTAMCCPTAAPGSLQEQGRSAILVEGDKRMFNQYGVMLVNPEKHPNVKKELGQQFIDFLISPEGQKVIANYKINGEQLFYPNATDVGA